MAITPPVPIPAAPPAPSRADPATFEERNDAAVEYQFNTLPGAIDQQSEATYQNALAGQQFAQDAKDEKDAAILARLGAENARDAAEGFAEDASDYKDSAWAAAAAAGVAAGLPEPLIPGRVLGVKSDGSGVEWRESTAVGDVLTTTRDLSAPEWLPCNGQTVLQASYPELFDELGLLMSWSENRPVTQEIHALAFFGSFVLIAGAEGSYARVANYGAGDTTTVTSGFGSSTIRAMAYLSTNQVALAGDAGKIGGGTTATMTLNTANTVFTGSDTIYAITEMNTSGAVYALFGGSGGKAARLPNTQLATHNPFNLTNQIGFGGSDIRGLARGDDGLLIAVGQLGKIAVALEASAGSIWSHKTSGTTHTLNAVHRADGKIVAVGDAGTIVTSDDDGETWVVRDSGVAASLNAVVYANGAWHVFGAAGVHLSSVNLSEWKRMNKGFPQLPARAWNAALVAGNRVLTGGASGFLAQTSSINYDASTLFSLPPLQQSDERPLPSYIFTGESA